jgi:hypothetical protein
MPLAAGTGGRTAGDDPSDALPRALVLRSSPRLRRSHADAVPAIGREQPRRHVDPDQLPARTDPGQRRRPSLSTFQGNAATGNAGCNTYSASRHRDEPERSATQRPVDESLPAAGRQIETLFLQANLSSTYTSTATSW